MTKGPAKFEYTDTPPLSTPLDAVAQVVRFNYEPMKPLSKIEAQSVARLAQNTSAEYEQAARSTENAMRLLEVKATNFRMIAAALKGMKR
jgi:hypothetical protein